MDHFESLAAQEILGNLQHQLELHSSIISSKIVPTQKTVDSEENLFAKIQESLEFLMKAVSITKSELSTSNTFSQLAEIMEEEEYAQNESLILEKAVKNKREQLEKLETSLTALETSCLAQNREQICLINELKDKVELAKGKGEEDVKFAALWLTARNDYAKEVLHKGKVIERRNELKKMEENIDRDCTAYESLAAWTKLKSIQTDRTLEQWKIKFAKDVQKMEKAIEKKRKTIKEQEEKIERLRKLIDERVEELIPWEEEKAQERLERIQHMRRYYSCRKIQRWWRKYMVQRGLYKKKKVKAKPKEKRKPKSGNKNKGE